MKQYNLEDQLKQKLGDRAITPSAEAWERIAFNRQQKKKKKRPVWYWIAAAVVISIGGVLLFSLINSNTTMPVQPQVVVTNKPELVSPVDVKPVQHLTPVEIKAKTEVAIGHKNPVVVPEKVEETLEKNVQPLQGLADAETVKANEVALAIHQIAEVKGSVTEEEIDSLLHKAQRQVALERLKSRNLPTNDTALLKEAEKEVENSFRDKTFVLFKLKFKTIKVALKDQ